MQCDDVAQAIFNAATAPGNTAAGKTLDLAGPKVYTNKYIFEFVMDQIKEDSNLMLLPPSLMQATAAAMGVIPNPWMSLDMDVRRKDPTSSCRRAPRALRRWGWLRPT